jgi:hypothetical protein
MGRCKIDPNNEPNNYIHNTHTNCHIWKWNDQKQLHIKHTQNIKEVTSVTLHTSGTLLYNKVYLWVLNVITPKRNKLFNN